MVYDSPVVDNTGKDRRGESWESLTGQEKRSDWQWKNAQGKHVVWTREWDEAKEEQKRARSEGRCEGPWGYKRKYPWLRGVIRRGCLAVEHGQVRNVGRS